MIISRRKKQFYITPVVFFVLPLVAIAALFFRPSFPTVEEDTVLTFSDLVEPPTVETVDTYEPLQVKNIKVFARTIQLSDESILLELEPQKAFGFSEVLVYWLPENGQTDPLDDKAVLLGELSGALRHQFELPKGLLKLSNRLVFYTQRPAKVIDRVALEKMETQQSF